MALSLKLSRQEDTAKEFGDQMLVQLETRLTRTIDQALQDRNAAIRFEDSIQPLDDTEEKEALLLEMKRQKAMIDAVRQLSEEALKEFVSQRSKQRIHDVKSIDNSISLAGLINVEGSQVNRDQDISKVYANGRSISIAGVANNIDINSMFANMRS